jgi:hypothetical protein
MQTSNCCQSVSSSNNYPQVASKKRKIDNCCIEPAFKKLKFDHPVKTIDSTFFCEMVTRKNNEITITHLPKFNMIKLALLRNGIKEGDRIRLDIHIDFLEHLPERTSGHVSNFLKILRLAPENENPTVLFDVSSLINYGAEHFLKKDFPQLIEKDNRWILPCSRKPLFPKMPQDEKEKKFIEYMQETAKEICELIASYLPLEQTLDFPFIHSYRISKTMKAQYNLMAARALQGDFFRFARELFISFSPQLEVIQDKVTKLHLSFVHIPRGILSQLSLYFPKVRVFSSSQCQNADEAIEELQHFSKLRSLDLYYSDLKGSTFASLPSTLKKLTCFKCPKIEDKAIKALAKIPLKKLDISWTRIKEIDVLRLPESLKTIVCRDNKMLSRKTRKNLQKYAQAKNITLIGL